MDSSGSNSSKGELSETISFESANTPNSNKLARLKRLKIQENLLIKSINQSIKQISDNEHPINYLNTAKRGLDMRNDYIEIRNLFQHVKETSNNQDILEDTDIIDIKKDVLLLEDKFNKIQESLQMEMMRLKVSEKIAIDKINEKPLSDLKKNARIKVKSYSDVVTSPVKAMINSPLKCAETQDFHDFIATHGRYGNWVEYNHNIFVHTWRKYFPTYDENFELLESDHFHTFQKEIMSKIVGVTKDEVLEHSDWYSKFLQLKYLRQEAIDRWKGNKSLIKASRTQNSKSDDNNQRKLVLPKRNRKLCQEDVESNERHAMKDLSERKASLVNEAELIERLTQPTGQWSNRIYGAFDVSDSFGVVHNLDMIKKLRVPEWRLDLQDT